jgi:hypothetical protein
LAKFDKVENINCKNLLSCFANQIRQYFYLFFLDTTSFITNMMLIKCSDICLRSKWSLQDVEAAGFVSFNLHQNGLLGDIMQVYSSYYSMDQALLSTRIHFYGSAFYTFQEDDGDYQEIKIYVGDVVEIGLEEGKNGFASVKAILRHRGNDGNDYVFIFVYWFEDISKQDTLLLCPIYQLQSDTNNSWYCIHPISTVKKSTSKASFVHSCDSRCTADRHETSNREYLYNNFLFSAI